MPRSSGSEVDCISALKGADRVTDDDDDDDDDDALVAVIRK